MKTEIFGNFLDSISIDLSLRRLCLAHPIIYFDVTSHTTVYMWQHLNCI